MVNLKAKFIKDIEYEIEETKETIKRLKDNLKLIPEQITVQEKHIEDLKGLLESVESNTTFEMSEITYEDEEEWI
jgi:hypothetical protein